ncbi:hypothetical protein XELAEV_18002747mg [Xenopus laevis]|nr:hypothetical protein XELAEV_18002747mg [Xenopus laevis]
MYTVTRCRYNLSQEVRYKYDIIIYFQAADVGFAAIVFLQFVLRSLDCHHNVTFGLYFNKRLLDTIEQL